VKCERNLIAVETKS